MIYDVVVAGGGPSGALSAISLIGSGARVLILDKANFPRIKPCGGGISYRVFGRFPYLTDVFESVPINYVHRVVLKSPSGEIVESVNKTPLYAMVRRYEFDAALLEKCKRGGIEVREHCTVSRIEERKDSIVVSTNLGEKFVTRFLIGADGVNSVVAIQSGLRQSWARSQVAIDGTEESITLNTDRDTMYVHYGIDSTYGYGYVFPKCDHVNLGVGYLLSYFRDHIHSKPWDDHEKFIQRLREDGVINGISLRENFHASLLPVAGPLRRLSTNRIVLVGDAGGFVNGFTAEGIYYAMVSGEHAGITVREVLSEKVPNARGLRSYDERCLKEVGDELRRSVSIQEMLLADPTRIDKIVALARQNPAVRQLVTQFAVGALSYIRFRRQVMLRALPFYVSHKVSKVRQKLS